jgi:predicted nucleic acid-binding protein
MRIYFDACAINRLTDDRSQPRIRDEARAVEIALSLVANGGAEMVASTALRLELRRNPEPGKRSDSMRVLSYAGALIEFVPPIRLRAEELERSGYGAFDAVHLASAEHANAHILLTTDDRFCKLALRRAGRPTVDVGNPFEWARKTGLL